jgi:hypothetical protein
MIEPKSNKTNGQDEYLTHCSTLIKNKNKRDIPRYENDNFEPLNELVKTTELNLIQRVSIENSNSKSQPFEIDQKLNSDQVNDLQSSSSHSYELSPNCFNLKGSSRFFLKKISNKMKTNSKMNEVDMVKTDQNWIFNSHPNEQMNHLKTIENYLSNKKNALFQSNFKPQKKGLFKKRSSDGAICQRNLKNELKSLDLDQLKLNKSFIDSNDLGNKEQKRSLSNRSDNSFGVCASSRSCNTTPSWTISRTDVPSSQHSSFERNTKNQLENNKLDRANNKKPNCYLVEVRAVVLKIGDIDTLNEKFYAETFIEIKWVDSALSPDTKYNSEEHWNPQIYVLNCLGDLKQQVWYNQFSIEEYELQERKFSHDNQGYDSSNLNLNNGEEKLAKIITDKQTVTIIDINQNLNYVKGQQTGCVIVERRRISGQFWQTLNLKNFPADVQDLTITLSTPKQENEIKLIHSINKHSSVNTKCFVDSQEWRLYKHITVREFLRDSVFSLETYPAIDLTINAARKPTFYYLNAFFLIFLITLSSLSTFSIRCHMNQSRIQTTCTLLLTSITFKWITNRSLPTVSYMTSLDKYSLSCLLILCALCIWHSLISVFLDIEQKCNFPYSYYDHIAFVVFLTVFILIHVVLFCWLFHIPYEKRRILNKQEMDHTNEMMGKRSTRLKSILYGL